MYLQKGGVKLSVLSRKGKEAVVAMLGPGEFFGEGSLAGQPLRLGNATTTTRSSVLVIEKTQMAKVLHEQHALSDRFLAHMLARNVRIEKDLIDQLFNSSEKRLARALLLLARFGTEDKPRRVVPKISQETLSEMVGTTRARVNFFMNKFKRLGFIEYDGDLDAGIQIKMGSTLTTASNSAVVVNNGSQSCNVFWQVGSSATLGTDTALSGNILALTSITLTTGARTAGRTLARNGAVTMDTNSVEASTCAPAPPPPCPAITLSPSTLPNGTVGVAYTQTLLGSGGTAPYSFGVTAGALPAGLTLTAAGVLTGTPTTSGTSTFTVRGTDANRCVAEISFTAITLTPVPTLAGWAMIMLMGLLALAGFSALRRQGV